MTLHEHLRTHHTVRLSNGAEVEKPELYEMFEGQTRDNAFRTLSEDTCKNALLWENATEVIKLPNWMEFWDSLGHGRFSEGGTVAMMDEYWSVAEHAPTLSEFVPVGENGEVLEEPDALDFCGKWSADEQRFVWSEEDQYDFDCFNILKEQYQTALSNVTYYGWSVNHRFESLSGKVTIYIENQSGIVIVFTPRGVEYKNKMTHHLDTTDELNRHVQLYMKIK